MSMKLAFWVRGTLDLNVPMHPVVVAVCLESAADNSELKIRDSQHEGSHRIT